MTWENILKRKINWLDAFDKFGFDDGAEYEGQTEKIADFLEENMYSPTLVSAGAHNTYISRILDDDGKKVYPRKGEHSRYGERYLFSKKLLKLLDDEYGRSKESEHIKD